MTAKKKQEELGDSGVIMNADTLEAFDRMKANLHQRLAAIHQAVSFLKKENQGFNFKYVSSSQALLAIRSVMDVVGVILMPSMTNVLVGDHTTAKGKHEYFTQVSFDMTWVNVDKPEDRETLKWYGQGLADGEQGPGIAATYAEKFFILKFFNIATDQQDPDNAENQKRRAEASGAPAKKASAQTPSPATAKSGPPKHIAILLNSPKHKPMLETYASFSKKSKSQITAELASLWKNTNGDEKEYFESVTGFLATKTEPAPEPEPEVEDNLPF